MLRSAGWGKGRSRVVAGVVAVVVSIGVAGACTPPPSDPGSPPTTVAPLPDPPGSFSVLSYNVAGLPQGISGSEPERNLPLISPLLNAYDVVLTQEDFDWWVPAAGLLDFANYHTRLRADAVHPYRTDRHPGPQSVGVDGESRGLLVGDGIGIMAKYPLTGEAHHAWKGCFGGVLPDGGAADCLAMKGFRVVTMTLGDGREVDVYSLHAEAGGTATDQWLQERDYEELAAFIAARGDDRAIVLGGDTNLHTDLVHPDGSGGADIAIWDRFLEATGLTDVCTELSCAETGSIDKFAYRSSSTVSLQATSIEFPRERFSVGGEDLSDHPPVVAGFDWDVPGT
ncbi:MAG: endonuclease/exonuclease/phosphatase family protein [Actinomycetota bacterium]|nr:endonuclease/exonuclease/phosphatase family protein [Actinomycetota bacterium]